MTARDCLTGKIKLGKVSERAGKALLDMMTQWERDAAPREAAAGAAEHMSAEAARTADIARGQVLAQADVLARIKEVAGKVDELRATPGDFGFGNKAPPSLGKETQTPLGSAVNSLLARDPFELTTGGNVHMLARNIRANAQAMFAEAIEFLRPKRLGFKAESVRDLDVLRALYGEEAAPEARAAAQAFTKAAEDLRRQYVDAGGALAAREKWRLPNPDLDPTKVRAMGRERFKDFVRQRVDRSDMLDFTTGKPMTDTRFEALLDQGFETVSRDGAEGTISAASPGRRMLANQRDFGRVFVWKDAASWQQVAENLGTHVSAYGSMMAHMGGMADDIAMLRMLGPNPEGTKRFILDIFSREANRLSVEAEGGTAKALAAATRTNRLIEARVATERKLFEDRYAEVSGANRIPVNTAIAKGIGDARHLLTAAQLGSALISSVSDLGTMAMTARLNRIPVMKVVGRAVSMAFEKGSEIHAAQMGLTADTLAHAAGETDRVMGENIRSGLAAKLSTAVIRASGLRRWTALLRAAFGLEMMAKVARERNLGHGELEPQFRAALERYGIGEAEWKTIADAAPIEPRPNALLTRPADIADQAVSEKFARLIHTEMDYAVIEGDPVTRSMLIGDSRPGSVSGELRRNISMYRQFPGSFMMYHFARGMARGWDGSRLGHLASTFLAMTAFGALAMQIKEINAGRDPLSLDPSTGNGARAWGKAVLQGGGLGVFGDLFFVDKTRLDNSWAAIAAGPLVSATEDVLGKFLMRNIDLAVKGKPTHFAGDALYLAGRYAPGSSLWYTKLAFQRAVLDQAARMIDERAPERFARMEQQARQDFGQSYWLPPGRTEPRRAPDMGAMIAR